MHRVFGLRNKFFAKMFYSYLVEYKSLSCVVNYQTWIEKLWPFWDKKEPDDITEMPEFVR